jgi:hypothetical protein
MMTKKLARIEPHSSLRRLVIFASTTCPAMSKRMVSPSLRPSVRAMPCSTDASATPGPSWYQRPAVMSFPAGAFFIDDRLNSRSASRRALSAA